MIQVNIQCINPTKVSIYIFQYYVRYGPDYTLISKQFELIVEQKITTKFISQFCFQLNRQTYEIIVVYLKVHKEQKGQKQITYDNLWPQVINDQQIRTQIENLPTDIMRILNKDLSQAYNLMMESLTDPTLQKLIRYDRIRDLYQFVTQIILNKKNKPKREKKQKKQVGKQGVIRRVPTKISDKKKDEKLTYASQWTLNQQRYLCALYLQRSLIKCSQKMKQKFGQNQKWDTTKKVFNKAEQIFERSLRRAFKQNQFKELIEKLQTNRQNLISQIMKRKTSQIEKFFLKYYKTKNKDKKRANLREIAEEIPIILQKDESLSKHAQKCLEVEAQPCKVKEQVNSTDQIITTQDSLIKVEETQQSKINTESQN